MNASDVIGYAYDADVYCPDCCPVRDTGDDDSECFPIFASEECDCPQHCSECHVLLPVTLTADGVQYVREAAMALHRDGRGDQAVLSEWVSEYLDGEWPREYTLKDDGTLDTVVSVFCSGCGETVEVRISQEEGAYYRDESGAITDEGWATLCHDLDCEDLACGCDS